MTNMEHESGLVRRLKFAVGRVNRKEGSRIPRRTRRGDQDTLQLRFPSPPIEQLQYLPSYRHSTARSIITRQAGNDGFSSIAYNIHEDEAFPLVLRLPRYHNEIASHEPITHTFFSCTIMNMWVCTCPAISIQLLSTPSA